MRHLQTKLYSVTPFILLPLMDFRFDEIPDWLAGNQFRSFVSDFLSQIVSGIVDAIIVVIVNNIYGL